MLKYFDGTVFNAPVESIVNTVNTTGAMGAGIALEFALRYPEMFKDYEEKCKKGKIVTGKVDYYFYKNKTIINFPTKQFFKYPSRLEWIEQGLIDFVKTYKDAKIKSVAFPKLGTLNGKLNWNIVKNIMEKYLSSLDIDVYICLDAKQDAEGKEKEMLDLFNDCDINVLANSLKLNDAQRDYLYDKKPFNRFWKIGAEKPIKGTAYKKIFDFFYNYKPIETDYGVQASLFD